MYNSVLKQNKKKTITEARAIDNIIDYIFQELDRKDISFIRKGTLEEILAVAKCESNKIHK